MVEGFLTRARGSMMMKSMAADTALSLTRDADNRHRVAMAATLAIGWPFFDHVIATTRRVSARSRTALCYTQSVIDTVDLRLRGRFLDLFDRSLDR